MLLRVPSYYKEFQCLADRCKDSCCIGWEIDIDEDTCEYYKSIGGKFGERLKKHMVTEDGVDHFVLEENGWCPFLNEKKLCDICIELGEETLSEVCTEYPRFTVEYGNVMEKALCLSCEEVGRLLFSSKEKTSFEEQELSEKYWGEEVLWEEAEEEETEIYGEEEDDGVSEEFRSQLENIRNQAIAILQDRTQKVEERMKRYLLYCAKMQQISTGRSTEPFSGYESFLQRMKCLEELEVLDGEWTENKQKLYRFFKNHDYEAAMTEYLSMVQEREYEYEHLLVYFTFRYFMKAWYDGNLLTKAQFAVVSCLVIRDMDCVRYFENGKNYSLADRIDTARIYAKEVEHSEENMELLEEAFAFEEVFHVEQLMKQISLGKN